MFTKWWMENLPSKKNALMTAGKILLGATLLATAAGCSLLPSESEEEVLPTINPPKLSQKPEYTVSTEILETKVRGIGKVMSEQEETLFYTLEGQGHRVKELYVKSGDVVEKGQLLAELDVVELQNTLRTSELQFRSEEIEMKKIMRNANEMSPQDFEQAKIQFERKRDDLVKLREQIDRAKLYAPFTGSIVSISKNKGDTVQAYDAAMVVADLSQLAIAVSISKDDLTKVAEGMEATVEINTAGQHKGKVLRLPLEEDKSNNNNNNFGNNFGQEEKDSISKYLLIEIAEIPESVTRGTPLSASIITQRKENVTVIPPSTLRSYGGRTYVQVIEPDGTRREVDVEVGQQTPTAIEILQGLEPGQKVVGR